MKSEELLNYANSPYQIEAMHHGFRVYAKEGAPERVPVRVICQPRCFEVNPEEGTPLRFGFYEYYGLSSAIAELMMRNWDPPKDRDAEWAGVREWAVKQTARSLGKRIHHAWKSLLGEVDHTTLEVHRAIFAATRKCAELVMREDVYDSKYVVADIIKYRAAAIAAVHVDHLADCRARMLINQNPEVAEFGTEWRRLCERGERLGLDVPRGSVFPLDGDEYDGRSLRIAYESEAKAALIPDPVTSMENWPGLFSYDGEPHRSLNRTLMNLPGGIPHSLLRNLRYCVLQRPVTKRLELLLLLWAAGFRQPPLNSSVFAHSREPEIKEAMSRVAAHTHNELSTRRARDVNFLVAFLADFPEAHVGNLVGLADKSIRWHRDEQARNMEKQVKELGGDTKTRTLPVMPEIEGIRFLETVEAVCREGVDMNNCVASYANMAVLGACFLFHAEYKGEMATCEVTQSGVSALGPGNTRNKAARWAKRMLGRWRRKVFVEPYVDLRF